MIPKKVKSAFRILSALFISCTFSSCVTTQVATLRDPAENSLEVYLTKKPARDYEEIMYIQADGAIFHSSEKLLEKLKQRAEEEGADAIVNVTYDHQFWWPYVSGTAVKFID